MIVKRIPAAPFYERKRAHAAQARDLINYMSSPDKESEMHDYLVQYMSDQKPGRGPERLLHIRGLNFVSKDLPGQRAEMMATAQAAVRSPNPLDHWLISWRENERPDAAAIDRTVEMFLAEIGMSLQQCIYAAHGDTHNVHVHIALNRYDPFTRRMKEIEGGWYREAAHRAIARIVAEFEWEAEVNARYEVVEGELRRTTKAETRRIGQTKGELPKGLTNAALGSEQRSGYRSAQRIGQEVALPIILASQSWSQVHRELAAEGIAYELVGTNGAVLVIGDQRIKASAVSRAVTPTRLTSALGKFVASDCARQPRTPEKDRLPWAYRAEEFRQARAQWKVSDTAERKALKLTRPAPDLETHLHRLGEAFFAERLRRRFADWEEADGLVGDATGQPPMEAVDGYRPFPCLEGIRYSLDGQKTAFLDTGAKVVVPPGSDEALLAALKLSIAKFGKVRVTGSRETRRRVLQLARDNNLEDGLLRTEGFLRRAVKARINERAGASGEASNATKVLHVSADRTSEGIGPVPAPIRKVGGALDLDERGPPERVLRSKGPSAKPRSAQPELPSVGRAPHAPRNTDVHRRSDRYDHGRAAAAHEKLRAGYFSDFAGRFEDAFAHGPLPFDLRAGRADVVAERLDEGMGEGSARFASAMSEEMQPFFDAVLQNARERIRSLAISRYRDVVVVSQDGVEHFDLHVFGIDRALASQLLRDDPAMKGLKTEISEMQKGSAQPQDPAPAQSNRMHLEQEKSEQRTGIEGLDQIAAAYAARKDRGR